MKPWNKDPKKEPEPEVKPLTRTERVAAFRKAKPYRLLKAMRAPDMPEFLGLYYLTLDQRDDGQIAIVLRQQFVGLN